jgi:tetratricopeptide (TPR) repeat protein
VKKIWLFVPLVVLSGLLAGCSKGNIFSFAHTAGDTANINSLSSDASTALQAKDYAKALDYYKKLLASDPNDAQAIYGYAESALANSGLDVGDLIANLIRQQNQSPQYQHLAPAIGTMGNGLSSTNILPQSIIDRITILFPVIKDVLSPGKLPKIVLGRADSRISPTNTDVNINVAFCLLLHAAMTAEGVIKFDTDYNATIITTDHVALASAARTCLKDIASANARFKVVVKALNLGSGSSLKNIEDDISKLFSDAKTKLSGSPYNIACGDIDVDTDYLDTGYLQ